jgi:pyruvate/2-oxoglutarate dehydrogenase complex dihydrolipoamide dehydrogenase (E3) component
MKGIDYDLVIIGGTATARYAAARAAQQSPHSRIALVEPTAPAHSSRYLQVSPTLHRQALAQAAQVAHQFRHADLWGFPAATPPFHWQTLIDWTNRVAETINEAQSPDRLAAAGVDVIIGNGAFTRQAGFEINGRYLRSRAYLLAPHTQPYIPPFIQIQNPLTPNSLIHQPWQHPPDRLLILSNEPAGIEIAQSLNRLGTQVTLITEQTQLLKQADTTAIAWLRSQLEAEGITIFTGFSIKQVEQQGDLKQVQAGDKTFEAEELLVAMGQRSPLEDLNLEAIDVKWYPQGIPVNRHLQTSNLQVYACGEVLGGYALPLLAEYEANIALSNALSLRKISTEYQSIPWGTQTQPEFMQVGLTADQARKTYKGIQVVPQSQMPESAALQNEPIGFSQIIVRRNGHILGAQAVGMGARKRVEAIALAMRSGLKVEAVNPKQ